MSTTNLFVELMVIGVGAFIWLLLLAGVISPELNAFLLKLKADAITAIPVIAVIYVLGILSDKSIDAIFYYLLEIKIRKKKIRPDSLYYKKHNAAYTKYPDLANKLEYIKSRIRIIRSWTVHFLLIALALAFYILVRIPEKSLNHKPAVIISTVFILACFSVLSFLSWYWMTNTYFDKIKDIK